MKTMALIATARRHTNVLMHMAGHLKKLLDAASKQELMACIDEYRRELVPLVVPLTLLRHHVRTHQVGVPARADVSRAASPGADAQKSGLSVCRSATHVLACNSAERRDLNRIPQ